MSKAFRPLYRAALLRNGAGLADAELLEGFVTRRNELFFEALVRRHGPMVLGVCQRILRHRHDAEDAFQATFLVLARRAAAIVPRGLVANWLYGVAQRTAREARRAVARRRAREKQVNDMPHPLTEDEDAGRDLLPLLDRELDRLPAKYRAAVVLCHLEGLTRKEAARQLGLPVGTLSGRLTTALRMLARRLDRQGISLSVGALAAALMPKAATAYVPASLIASTVKSLPVLAIGQAASAGAVSAEVASLAKSVMKSLLLARLKTVTVVLLAAATLGGGTAGFAYRSCPSEPAEPQLMKQPDERVQAPSQKPAKAPSDKVRLQGEWDPIASEVEGTKSRPPNPKIEKWRLVFEGDKITVEGIWRLVFEGDKKTVEGMAAVPYTLATDKQPKEMDFMLDKREGPMRVIYELDGDRLKLSWTKRGVRPLDFDTIKNESVLIFFERRKKR
jgi:RNA polymerase sigma-70 factor (ECF subfamily)